MTDEQDSERREHFHRWSLLKDRDFYEMSDLVTRYIESTQGGADCPHTDSPLVDAVETLAFVLYQDSPLPEDNFARRIVMDLMQMVGNMAFSAGIRFERDGQRLDSENFTKYEVREPAEDHKWTEERGKSLHEWRENMRNRFYRRQADEMPEALRKILEAMTGHNVDPHSQVMVATPEILEQLKAAGIRIPGQKTGETDGVDGTGLYL